VVSKRRALASDFGPAHPDHGLFRAQHDPIKIEEVKTESKEIRARARVFTNDPLRTYRKQKCLNGSQEVAGRMLEALFVEAGMQPKQVSRYTDMIAFGNTEDSQHRALDAEEKYESAMDSIPSPVRSITFSVCCLQQYYPESRKKADIIKGLDALVKYFGI